MLRHVTPSTYLRGRRALWCLVIPRRAQSSEAVPPRGAALRHRGPSSESVSKKDYSKSGYDFIENMRSSNSSVSVTGMRNTVWMITMVIGFLCIYLVYYLTTYQYILTTDRSPKLKKFQHFPCDFAIIENKWTGSRKTVELESSPDDRASAITTKTLYVNALKDRVLLYIHKTKCDIVVDLKGDLDPFRFLDRKNGVPSSVSSSLPTTTPTKTSVQSRSIPNLFVQSTVRAKDSYNGYQMGSLPIYRQVIRTVVQEKVLNRYKELILAQCGADTHPVFAQEFMKNGTVNGLNIKWEDIVPDITAFTEEIQKEVTRRMGEDILIYDFRITTLKATP